MTYVSIYRDGIPILVPFKELKVGDETISSNPNLKFTVSYHDAQLNGEEWFVHDRNHNPYFEADFDDNNPECQ